MSPIRRVPVIFTCFYLWIKSRYSSKEVWGCATPPLKDKRHQTTSWTGGGACTQLGLIISFPPFHMHLPCSILALQNFEENQSPHLDLKSESKFGYSSFSMDCINFIPYISLVLVGKTFRKNIFPKLLWSEIWLWHGNPSFSIQSTWRVFFC